MIYLIYGNQTPTIKSRVNKIAKAVLESFDEMNFAKYNGETSLVQEYVDDANYLPLGYDKKVIVVDNCYYFIKPKPRQKIEADQDYDTLKRYLENPNEDVEFILTVVSGTVDTKSEIYQLIEKNGKVIQIVDPDQLTWKEYVKKYCRDNLGMQIDSDALEELSSRTMGDVALLQNNAKKLALYKDHIKYEDVTLMVARPLEDNTFQIFNYLLQGKNMDALLLYRDLRINNIEPVTLIGQIANQMRLLNQISFLSKKGLSNDEIANELAIKPVRVQIMKKNLAFISEKTIQNTLEKLYELDMQIKSGSVDRFYAFELFLINFKRK